MKYSIYAEEAKHHNTAVTDCGMFIQFNVKMSRVAPTLRQYLHLCEVGMTALLGHGQEQPTAVDKVACCRISKYSGVQLMTFEDSVAHIEIYRE